MEIRIDPHTLERALERGASEAEIRDALINGDPIPAKHNRLAKEKIYVITETLEQGNTTNKKEWKLF